MMGRNVICFKRYVTTAVWPSHRHSIYWTPTHEQGVQKSPYMGKTSHCFNVLADMSHEGHLPCISSLSLELSSGDCLRLQRSPGSAVPNGDRTASVPRALNPWAICVQTAKISVAYNTGSTLGGHTGGATSSITVSSGVFNLVFVGILQTRDMHQSGHKLTRNQPCWPDSPPHCL